MAASVSKEAAEAKGAEKARARAKPRPGGRRTMRAKMGYEWV